MITLSQIISQIPQVDGRIDVTELHTYADGTKQKYNYLADSSLDLQVIADARAANINAELTRRATETATATDYEIPLTDIEIMKRITPSEWEAFQVSTNTTIAYFRAIFMKTDSISRNDPLTAIGFNALVSEGILTAERVAEVLA